MSKQHYLPASYIGRFSADTDGPHRKRRVWVQRVGNEPYLTKAENVGYARALYDSERPGGAPTSVDNSWKYEGRLPEALDALSD